MAINPGPFDGWQRGMLIRGSLDDKREMTAYLTFAPAGTSLKDLVLAAGARWNIERCYQESKSQLGLDQDEVRTWAGWHRNITLVMAAYALLDTLRRRQLTKSLLLSLSGQGPWSSPRSRCGDGCVSPPLPDDEEDLRPPYTGRSGVGCTTHRRIPSPGETTASHKDRSFYVAQRLSPTVVLKQGEG